MLNTFCEWFVLYLINLEQVHLLSWVPLLFAYESPFTPGNGTVVLISVGYLQWQCGMVGGLLKGHVVEEPQSS